MVIEDSYSEKYQDGAIRLERVRHPMLEHVTPPFLDLPAQNFFPIVLQDYYYHPFTGFYQRESMRQSIQFIFPQEQEIYMFETMHWHHNQTISEELFSPVDSYPFQDHIWGEQERRQQYDHRRMRRKIYLRFTENFLPNFQRISLGFIWDDCSNQLERDVYEIIKKWNEERRKELPITQKRKETVWNVPSRHAKMNIKVH